jgi:hypothetical protein
LQEHGFDPGPKRGRGTWHEFVQRHIKTLWATDFLTKTVWTLRGPVTYYILFFIHLHTRRVHIAGMTHDPDGIWVAQMARNMSMVFAAECAESQPTHIIRDRDSKFTAQFCSILEADGIEFRPIPPRAPNLNPFANVASNSAVSMRNCRLPRCFDRASFWTLGLANLLPKDGLDEALPLIGVNSLGKKPFLERCFKERRSRWNGDLKSVWSDC